MCRECESLGLDDFPTSERLQWHGLFPVTPDWSETSRFVAFTLVRMLTKRYKNSVTGKKLWNHILGSISDGLYLKCRIRTCFLSALTKPWAYMFDNEQQTLKEKKGEIILQW